MNRTALSAALVAAGLMLLSAIPAMPEAASDSSGSITPEPIPPRFGIPGSREKIQAIADANDVPAIRAHAWNVWAGLTADSQSSFQGSPLPIWETWLATDDVFTSPPTRLPADGELPPRTTPSRQFTDPNQFHHLRTKIVLPENSNPASLVGFNKFDPSMTRYLWVGHDGPASGEHRPPYFYSSFESQWSLNLAWPVETPLKDRKVVDAPASALELKPVMLWVSSGVLTAIPFWQGPNASTAANCANVDIDQLRRPTGRKVPTNCHPDPSTWTHCVLIDAGNPEAPMRAATRAEFGAAILDQAPKCQAENARYAGIDLLYHFKLSGTEAAAFNAAQQPATPARAGDFMVLAAMHVNTKEIVTWTWQTFWWQGGERTPDNYPGSADGRPESIAAPWNNYNMCAAYAQTTRPDNQGDMHVCFNPYLETSPGIPDGLRSNCVSCHGTAAINSPPTGGYPLSYYAPIDFDDAQYFNCATQADFSYAMTGNPTDAPTKAPSWNSGCPDAYVR